LNNNEMSTRPTDGVFKKNPIFVKMIAVTAAVIATKTVIGAAAFSAVLFCVLLLSNIITYPIFRSKKGNAYRAVFMIISAGFTSAAEISLKHISPAIHGEIAQFIPFVVISAVLIACTFEQEGFLRVSAESVFSGLGFGIALIGLAAIRELVSTGKIFSFPGYDGLKIFGEWFVPLDVVTTAAGALIFVGCALGVVRLISESRRESAAHRREEFERIKRGEHETLVLDENGVVVLRRTLMHLERDKTMKQEEEMIDLTISDDDFKFEFVSSDSKEENDEENVIFEEYDYE